MKTTNLTRSNWTRRAFLAAVGFGLTSLAGCGGSQQAEQLVPPYGLSGTVTIGEYLTKYTSYPAFDKGIKDGSSIPQSLKLFENGQTLGFVHDEATITQYWNALSAVRIDLEHPVYTPFEDGYLSFSFDSGQELITFAFRTADLADFGDRLYPVEDPAAVRELANTLAGLVEKPQEDGGVELRQEGNAYWWDANGNGVEECVSLEFIDNGDEAPNVLELFVSGDGFGAYGYVNGAYEVTSMKGYVDAQGPYLVVSYFAGDYYRHDHPAECMIRLVDDQLEVTELTS